MKTLNKRLVGAKVVLVVGNGGIAMELVHSLVSKQACQVWWYPVKCIAGHLHTLELSSAAYVCLNADDLLLTRCLSSLLRCDVQTVAGCMGGP